MRRRTLLRSAAVAATTGVAGVATAGGNRGGHTATEERQTTTEGQGTTTEGQTTADGGRFSVTSSAFEDGGTVPTEYTCDGENVSPPLTVSNPPEGTQSFALIVDDPDAPNPPFVHWLLWDVPADAREIPENVPNRRTVDSLGGAVQGTNESGEIGYVGPCPPEGTHTYLFELYALERPVDLDPGAEYLAVLDAVIPKALARARYVGKYQRG